jgi:hypothetical protein
MEAVGQQKQGPQFTWARGCQSFPPDPPPDFSPPDFSPDDFPPSEGFDEASAAAPFLYDSLR